LIEFQKATTARPAGFEIQPGQVLACISREESASLADAWLKVFGQKPASCTLQDYYVFSGKTRMDNGVHARGWLAGSILRETPSLSKLNAANWQRM